MNRWGLVDGFLLPGVWERLHGSHLSRGQWAGGRGSHTAWLRLPFPSLGFAALCPRQRDCSCSQVLISPGRHLHLLLPQAVLPVISVVCFFVFFPADKACFCFTPSWGNASSQVLSPLGLWPHLVFTALGLQKPGALPDGLTLGARGRWVSFFFTPAPGRLQLAGLQPGEGLGLESALRLFVERESAKCHRDFCPLALQALPAREPRASGQIHRQIQGRAGVQGCVGGP